MRRITLLLVCLNIFYAGICQDSAADKKARKEARAKEALKEFNTIGAAIASKNFVLEFENILRPSYNEKKVNPMLNFILVDSTKCTWHSEASDIPTDLFRTVTKVEGTIDGWKMETNGKNSRYFLEFRMFTDYGLFRITVHVYPDRTTSGNINGIRDSFEFSGRIVFHRIKTAR